MEKKILGGIELRQDKDGRWFSEDGTEYALSDDGASADPIVRCGVGTFSLPADSPFTPGCKAHDTLYSTPAYQSSNPRSRADRVLLDQLLIVAGRNPLKRLSAYAMYAAARLFGARFWEDDRTRDA